MNYFVGSKSECEAWIERMNDFMGYPNEATKTYRYAVPQPHASKRGEYLVPVVDVFAPKLGRRVRVDEMDSRSTQSEVENRKSRETLKAEGAFPTPESLGDSHG